MNDLLQALSEAFAPAFQFLFVVPRLSMLFATFPLLGMPAFPVRLRAALVLVVALAIGPTIQPPPLPSGLVGLGTFVVAELGTGALLGIAARVVLSVVQGASGLFANQAGFAISTQLDPLTGETSMVPTTFHAMLATVVFFAADLHHLLLATLVRSFDLIPVGDPSSLLSPSTEAGTALGNLFFQLSISLAAPALLLTITFDLLMLLAGKSMPQAPILLVTYPVKIALGMFGMVLLSRSIGHGLHLIADGLVRSPALFN